MEAFVELTFELLSSRVGLAMVAAVVIATVVLSSGLAASVVGLAEGIPRRNTRASANSGRSSTG